MKKSRISLLRRMAGFTLIEAVMVIVITGILSAVVAVFIQKPVEGYFDSARRAELTDAADAALRRIARDVRMALPNSLRGPNTSCIEFIPVSGGGRYRYKGPGTNLLDLNKTTAFSFDVLAESGVAGTPAGYFVVVNNTGAPGMDAYTDYNKRAIISPAVTGTAPSMSVSLASSINVSPASSSGHHFHVIPPHSVVYSCPGGTDHNLYRSEQSLAVAASSCPTAGTGTVLVSNVTSCSLKYVPSNDLLMMTLEIADPATPTETIRLFNEVQVNNAP